MKRTGLFIMGFALLLLAACVAGTPAAPTGGPASGEVAPATQAPSAGAEPIRIGASLPLTGMFSTAGQGHEDGYQLCVDLINEKGGVLGRPLELIVSDNRSDTETAVNQYERFINVDQVDLIFGTFSTLLSFPTSSIAEQAQMVYPEPADSALVSHSRGYKYNFGFHPDAIDFIGATPVDALIAYRDAGVIPEGEFPKTAAVVYTDDFFPNGIARGLLGGELTIPATDEVIDLSPGFLEEAGIDVVFTQQWPQGFSDWITLANSIKASGAEFLLALTVPPDEVEVVRALQTVGYNPKAMFMSQGTQSYFHEALGEQVNGIMIFTTWHPKARWEGVLAGEPFSNADFIAAFRSKFDRDPSEDEAVPFAVCQAMEQAVRATGTTDNTVLRDWLASRTQDDPVRTIQGDYYWDERGLPIGRHYLLTQWQDENLEFIYPRDEFPGVVDLLWPKPEW
jgi:branched-chain amino acid transport system substrate-binding protein